MIIVDQDGQWLCARQPDHARLGGQLAQQWIKPAAMYDAVWRRFLQVVSTHDDGWLEAESQPGIDLTGRPFDFITLPTHQHIDIWRRGIDLAARRDVYQGLLVAHHARWLYTNYSNHPGPSEQAAAAGFIGELTQRIVEYLQLLRRGSREDRDAVEPARLATAAALLSFFDSFSLLLLGALPPPQRMRSVVFNGHQAAIDVRATESDAGIFLCGPWPFMADQLQVRCPVRIIPRDACKNAADLAARLAAAPPHEKTWHIKPA